LSWTNHTDEQLLAAFADGDEAAFSPLVERHGAAVKSYALRMLRNPEQAEDVYVDVFTRLASGGGRWEQRGTVRGFLFTVAHRLCIDLIRRRKTEREARDGLVELTQRRRLSPSPEARAAWGQLAERVEEAIGRLPVEHRQVLLLRTVHGLSGEEVATAMGTTEIQVRSQLSYARKRLKALLTEDERAQVSGRKERGS